MDMQAFLEHVEAHDPGFRERIRGASQEAIAKLEARAGIVLPASYRAFLEAMGADDGGLNVISDTCTTDIDEVLGYYQELEDSGPRPGSTPPRSELEFIPEGCVQFAVGDSMFAEDIYLRTHPDKEPSILIGAAERIDYEFAESLEKLLYRAAFLKYVWPSKPESVFYSTTLKAAVPQGNALVRARSLAKELGLEALPFSDDYCFAAQGEGVFVLLRPRSLHVRGDDDERVKQLGARFGEAMDMKRSG